MARPVGGSALLDRPLMTVPYPTDRWRLPLMLLVAAAYVLVVHATHWRLAVFMVTLGVLDALTARPPHTQEKPMPITNANLRDAFTYHTLDDDQKAAYGRIEAAAIHLAEVILDVLPPCGDQQAALRLLFEAKATANRGVAVKGIV